MAVIDSPWCYCSPLNAVTRRMRDLGWYQSWFPRFLTTVPLLVASGIDNGSALEIGPGPGYLGLEWLKSTNNTTLVGLDASTDMVSIARHNTVEYSFAGRAKYILGDAHRMPLGDSQFDCVLSSASLHEWTEPGRVLDEVSRVLKPGGKWYITDLRRDISNASKWAVWFVIPKPLRPYFLASLADSYTIEEIKDILGGTRLNRSTVHKSWYGLTIVGQKTG